MPTDNTFRPVKTDGRGKNPKSLANLKPYKPGTNGHGRVYPLKERLYHALDKPLVEPKEDAPAGEHIVYATLKGAIDLVPVAFRETWDRTEGKVPGDQPPPVNIDNRVINFYVRSEKTKELLQQVKARTGKLVVGETPEGV